MTTLLLQGYYKVMETEQPCCSLDTALPDCYTTMLQPCLHEVNVAVWLPATGHTKINRVLL